MRPTCDTRTNVCKCHPKKQDAAEPGTLIKAWRNVKESCNLINGLNSWSKSMGRGGGRSVGSAEEWSQGANICRCVSSPVKGKGCVLIVRHEHAVHPISPWMPQNSSNSLPLFWFHAHKQPPDYNLASHVDFPTGENALTSQHEHLVHLAGRVLFVYECISVLVYISVSLYTPGATEVLILPALAKAVNGALFPPFPHSVGRGQRVSSEPQLLLGQTFLALGSLVLWQCQGHTPFNPLPGLTVMVCLQAPPLQKSGPCSVLICPHQGSSLVSSLTLVMTFEGWGLEGTFSERWLALSYDSLILDKSSWF